ncbi:MAG: 4-(cytidine 5'-diphospho)-2-C-methyl-D-erythritol kinase [Coriobacteriia bacterium]|nr:4-(cytidine 5'-diphospho)-2-C-methyl-D-erythritol kinase [Coriobacteriia bacterium]
MKVFSPAKINLALNVGAKMRDGYHRVDSVFHTLAFGDVVAVEPSEKLNLTCSVNLGIAPENNLAYKAAVLFARETGTSSNYSIHIDKRLPHGAGLGGGSSNAAAVIYALAVADGINPVGTLCMRIAASLGSDVPVFLAPTGASVMTERGEVLEESLPPATGVPVVLAMPRNLTVSTARVYKAFDESPLPIRSMELLIGILHDFVEVDAQRDLLMTSHAGMARLLAGEVYNNLAAASVAVEPSIGDALLFLKTQRESLCAEVSGSGSCVFALCATPEQAEALQKKCVEYGFFSVATSLRSQGVTKINEVSTIGGKPGVKLPQ